MAESSIFWTTNGTGDGTGSGYTQTQLFQLMRSFARTSNLGGVFPDVLNELAVTGTATPVAVNTGQAIIDGIVYFNSASVNVAIATPASLTRVDYIVLRASWAAQTVRITRIAGTEGAGAPSLTQSAGTTWDIPLATVSITTGGVITVTDAREWAIGAGDLTIDSTKLASNAVTNAKMATMSANTVKANNTGSSAVPSDVDVSTLLAAYIHAATAKSTPINADELALIDTAASNALKKVTLANVGLGLAVPATFTPALAGSGGSSGITYTTQSGYYFQIGKAIFFNIYILLSSKGTASGSVSITGFPVTVSANGIYINDISWDGTTSAYANMKLQFSPSTTVALLFAITAGSTSLLSTTVNFTGLANTTTLRVNGWYLTD